MNMAGHGADLFTVGVYMSLVTVVLHHLQIAINVRNWTVLYSLMYIISIAMVFMCFAVLQVEPYTQMYKHVYSNDGVMTDPLFWIMSIFSIGLGAIFFYGMKSYWMLISP
mmetsp:Transcript_20570/g.14805  ORF Transcript_20570/g.14805 Transcript_20570/m.14805 type:complete len:110 (-) Transcript_20570:29-358(-)